MEGVGARLGRSSTRYGPPTVFTGPVRKWKKKWVPVPPSNSNSQNHTTVNGAVNGSNASASHLLLYKWSPITPSQNKDANGNADSKVPNEDDAVEAEEPPRRKFKYIPIVVLEEENNESEDEDKLEETDEDKPDETDGKPDETGGKPDETDGKPEETDDKPEETDDKPEETDDKPDTIDEDTVEATSKGDGCDEKPDINDVPMEEIEAPPEKENSPVEQQHDLNESPLELSLGFKAHEGENESDAKGDQVKDDPSE